MVASDMKRAFGFAALLCAFAPATASAQQGYDPLQEVFEVIGITPKSKPQIEYRERPPLVVPPSTSKLRQPEAHAGERNANWPQDPDVLARKKKLEEARAPNTIDSDNDVTQGGITRGEVRGQRNRYAGVPNAGQSTSPNDNDRQSLMISPTQLKNILASGQNSKPLTPGVEPDRQYLTEPPKGYRKAAAGAPVKGTVEPMKDQNDNVQINALRPRQ